MNPDKLKLLQQLATLGDVIVTRYISTNYDSIGIKTQADAVLYFLQRLDINMVKLILEENRTYQDFEKSLFIKKIQASLDEFIESGDTFLNLYSGVCKSKTCNFNCKGYSFVGNNSNNYFDLIIDIKDGIVQDIYECISFKCDNESVIKKRCIEIDKSRMPF